MGKILDYYEYTEAMEALTNRPRGTTPLRLAVNMGIVDNTKGTIEEFLQAKHEEK
jgi:hypothetical protein